MKDCRLTDRGFTLIEVVVVAAIIAILAGMMIPFVYRVWESNEIETTRNRMSDLKKAMAGDPKLVQNGIRTNFGFVGDNGQLPSAIANPDFSGQYTVSNDLLSGSPMLYPNWSGPYMPPGYDPSNYKKDAWGRYIVYSVTTSGSRRVAASLTSAGPDGALGTSDDINSSTDPEVQINEREVTPTDVLQGNLNFVFRNSTAAPVTPSYTAKIEADYWGAFGPSTARTGCIAISAGSIGANESKPVIQTLGSGTTLSVKLPTGKTIFRALFYTTPDCSGASLSSNNMAVFIPDGINAISVNLPTINYTIP